MQHQGNNGAGAGNGQGRRGPRRALHRLRGSLTRAADTLALWHFRVRTRRELEQVDERLLRDMGIDRSEAYKPFWRE